MLFTKKKPDNMKAICGKCVATRCDMSKLKAVRVGKDMKVQCEVCKKMKFGVIYEVQDGWLEVKKCC